MKIESLVAALTCISHEKYLCRATAHHIIRLHIVLLRLVGAFQGHPQLVDHPHSCHQREAVQDRVNVILHEEAASHRECLTRGSFDLHLLECGKPQSLSRRLDLPAYEPDGQKEGREFLRSQGQPCSTHKHGC